MSLTPRRRRPIRSARSAVVRRAGLPLAAALAASLLTACGGSSTSAPSPSSPMSPSDSVCPPQPTWNPDLKSLQSVLLPSQPTVTIPANHLVPNTTPQWVWLCKYHFDGTARKASPLGVRRVENPDAVRTTLWAATPEKPGRRSCPLISTQNDGYLMELVYPDNTTMWLESPGPNVCMATTNATMRASENFQPQFDKAFTTGTWPS